MRVLLFLIAVSLGVLGSGCVPQTANNPGAASIPSRAASLPSGSDVASPQPGETQSILEGEFSGSTLQSPLLTAQTHRSATMTEPVLTPTTSVPKLTSTPICLRAAPGTPIDVTVPDGARLLPGEAFQKTWRLVNDGSCPWSSAYSVQWFSGMQMGSMIRQDLISPVYPGESIDITIDMVAPIEPGTYQSNWKLHDGNGNPFGLGPNGDAPFWTRIEVIAPENTPVPVLETSTPQSVFQSGVVSLRASDQFDPDTGSLNSGVADDFKFVGNESGINTLLLLDGVKAQVMGDTAPGFEDCRSLLMETGEIMLEDPVNQLYICYQTNAGLPGVAVLTARPVAGEAELTFEYTTWSIP